MMNQHAKADEQTWCWIWYMYKKIFFFYSIVISTVYRKHPNAKLVPALISHTCTSQSVFSQTELWVVFGLGRKVSSIRKLGTTVIKQWMHLERDCDCFYSSSCPSLTAAFIASSYLVSRMWRHSAELVHSFKMECSPLPITHYCWSSGGHSLVIAWMNGGLIVDLWLVDSFTSGLEALQNTCLAVMQLFEETIIKMGENWFDLTTIRVIQSLMHFHQQIILVLVYPPENSTYSMPLKEMWELQCLQSIEL